MNVCTDESLKSKLIKIINNCENVGSQNKCG